MCTQVAEIAERVDRLSAIRSDLAGLRRRHRSNRARAIHATLAIEGNRLSPSQVTAILDGKRVLASPREVQEVRNALLAYERFTGWMPQREQDLLEAHRTLMAALVDAPGRYRAGGVGVMAGDLLVHMAPPAHRISGLMADLLAWLGRAEDHPLISSSVFHYELEFIHPFADGNGRIGRLWQTLILSRWRALFADLPVETLVHAHQDDYYQAIADSTEAASATPFILFMLTMIGAALDELDKAIQGKGGVV
jgi:Fic family protein